MKTLIAEKEKYIWKIKLNRPDVRNAFNPLMIEELTNIFRQVNEAKEVRLVTLEGEGKVFCAGADLSWMKSMINFNLDENKEDAGQLFDMFFAIRNCAVPVLGIVHGAAFGGALGLVACCDLVVAEEKAQFCFSEVKLGIVPAVISGFVLDKCQKNKVMPHMLWGNVFTAAQACEAGLIHEVATTKKQADKFAEEKIQEILEAGPDAIRATKKLLHRIEGVNWDEKRNLSTQVISERRVSSEGQEGLLSFLEKRAPEWRITEDGSN